MTLPAKPLVHFVHGKESGPWGTKILMLADIAKSLGCDVDSIDYSSTFDPAERVDMLVNGCSQRRPDYLVGSSMGAWVALTASARMKVKGVFLMAPAIGIDGYPPYEMGIEPERLEIIHGYRDPLIPVENAIGFARKTGATLHLVDDEHRLVNRLGQLGGIFELFLKRMLSLEEKK